MNLSKAGTQTQRRDEMTITATTLRQRRNESAIRAFEYDKNQKALKKARYIYCVAVTDGTFCYSDKVGANDAKDAMDKVIDKAYWEWMLEVPKEKIRVTYVQEVSE